MKNKSKYQLSIWVYWNEVIEVNFKQENRIKGHSPNGYLTITCIRDGDTFKGEIVKVHKNGLDVFVY